MTMIPDTLRAIYGAWSVLLCESRFPWYCALCRSHRRKDGLWH